MADFSALKQSIETYIKNNGNKEITGAILQNILLSMVTTMGDGAINDNASDISDIKGDIQNINGDITNINGDITNINGDITDLNGGLSDEKNRAEGAEDTLQQNITAEENRAKGAETTTILFSDGKLVFKNASGTVLYQLSVYSFLSAITTRLNTGALYAGFATPSTTPAALTGQEMFYLATQAGTYTNFHFNGGDDPIVLTKDGIYFIVSGTDDDDWNAEPMLQLDDVPTAGSDNPVKSGGEYTAIENVEKKIDNKQTLFAPDSGYNLIEMATLKADKEYILTNLSNNNIVGGGIGFIRANGTTAGKTITGGSQGVNDNIPKNGWVSFYVNTDVVKINIRYSATNNYFSIVEKENKIDVLEKETLNQQVQLDSIGQATLQEQKISLSGGWQDVSYDLIKGMIYTLTKLEGTGSVTNLAAYDANDQLVTVTGFTNLVNVGDTCNITVAKDAVRIRAYFNGLSVTDIKSNLPTYTLNSIKGIQQEQITQNTEIEKLNDSVFQLKSFSASGWADWRSYSFRRGYSYKITNVSTNANSRVGHLTLRNSSGSVVSYTGTVSNLAPNESAVIVPNGDAVEFNAYFNGGEGKITIEDISVKVITTLYELNDAVQIQEGYSSKDAIKHTIIVSKTGAAGHFSSIEAAYASITDSSYTNQYEVQIFPGKYNETNLQVPAFTHTYGVFPNSVVVSNEGLTASPVFEQAWSSSKLSNMAIESHTGYCIHFDKSLSNQALVNTNLVLFHAVNNSSAIVGGGAMSKGTKYVWKNCVFRSNYPKSAACHTASGGVNDNTHLIFDSCIFINSSPKVGSVGGNGCDIVELINCSFQIGAEGLGNWFSNIRNTDDSTLYRLNRYAWNIIGGGNKNLSMWQEQSGKTIGLSADYPITISGSAAEVIFGYNPYVNNVKTARLDCTLISEYYIDDSQAGYPPYSELTDVYQLWKRLGDCSTTNKTLTVTVNGVSKTYTFTEDYLTAKTSQANIIAAMQAVLDNVTINTIVQSGYSYENVNTSDIIMIKVTSADILKGEFITHSGAKATSATDLKDIAGVACEDKPINEYVKVWTSAFRFDTDYADGEYGLDADGALDANAATKIGFIKGYNFYLY